MIGVALLGAGFMGRAHAAAYAALEDRARVRVVCALPEAEAEPVAERLGADVVADLDAAIAAPGVDAVDVCLPTPLHRPVVERALAAGRHVLVEKPIALTLEDADAIGAAAEASGRVLMVGHVLRFFPEIVELRRIIDGGELGRPRGVTALRLSAPPDWNDWMLDPARSGGTPVDLMLHDFDLALALLGPARTAYARAAEPRHVTAVVEHEAGEAVVEGSHAMPPTFPFTAGLRVLCEHGLVDHRFEAQPTQEGGNIGGGASSFVRVYGADGAVREPPVPAVDPWTAEVEHFVSCVEEGGPPRDGSFAQARAALAVALAARRSVETGRVEVVPANVNGGR